MIVLKSVVCDVLFSSIQQINHVLLYLNECVISYYVETELFYSLVFFSYLTANLVYTLFSLVI